MSAVITLFRRSAGGRHAVVLQARAKCFVLQHIRVHYISLQFNINVQCYQNISQVLLTSAFILWPPCKQCTCGFGIREKSDVVCGFLAYFFAVLRFSDPPYAPLIKDTYDMYILVRVTSIVKISSKSIRNQLREPQLFFSN